MTGRDDGDDDVGPPASPACLLHEIDPAYAGLDMPSPPPEGVVAWRKAERTRLIAARLALSVDERTRNAAEIATRLDAILAGAALPIVSVYWPFRGEPDLRPWMSTAVGRGIRIALPVVVGKGQPLAFREWRPGCRLARGVWDIPYPADGETITPTVVIAPLVGYDRARFRLGYGGGFFDRTLASLNPRPMAIGVGHPIGALATIHPQPHDIRMDVIVTGQPES